MFLDDVIFYTKFRKNLSIGPRTKTKEHKTWQYDDVWKPIYFSIRKKKRLSGVTESWRGCVFVTQKSVNVDKWTNKCPC